MPNFLVNDVDLVIAISEKTKSDSWSMPAAAAACAVIFKPSISVTTSARPRRPSDRRHSGCWNRKNSCSASQQSSRARISTCSIICGNRLSEEGLPDLPKLVIAGRRGFGSRDLAVADRARSGRPRFRGGQTRHLGRGVGLALSRVRLHAVSLVLRRMGIAGVGEPRARQILHRLERAGAGRSRPGARRAHRSARFRGVEGGDRRSWYARPNARGFGATDQDGLSRRHLAGVRSKSLARSSDNKWRC